MKLISQYGINLLLYLLSEVDFGQAAECEIKWKRKVEIELQQSERMANNEHRASLRRAELGRYGDRRWTRESENHRVRLPRRNHPMEHDERQDW